MSSCSTSEMKKYMHIHMFWNFQWRSWHRCHIKDLNVVNILAKAMSDTQILFYACLVWRGSLNIRRYL